ncbi:MAG: hypothetical protein AAF708_00865 [Deinococcota bacterium]
MEEALQYIVTTFVAASSIAGTALLKEAAKDAYTRLSDGLKKKISPADVKALEDNPKDDTQRQILMLRLGQEFKADEAYAKASFELAEALSQALKEHHAEMYHEFGLDLQRNKVKGDFNVIDNETEIRAQDNDVGRNFNIQGNKTKKH